MDTLLMPPVEQLYAENLLLKEELAVLKAQIDWLKRKLFGGGQSERLDRAQLLLQLGELEKLAALAQAKAPATITYERSAPREKRPLAAEVFAHLPVKETVVIEPEEVKAEPEAYEQFGEERTFDGARQREDGHAAGVAPERSVGVSGAGARAVGGETNKLM